MMLFQSQAFPTEIKQDFVWLFFTKKKSQAFFLPFLPKQAKCIKKKQNFNILLQKSQICNPAEPT